MFGDKDLLERLDKQHAQIEELILINKTLIKLLENERTKLDAISRFVTANLPTTAAFGTARTR